MDKTSGSKVVEAFAAWIAQYMVFTDAGMPVILALWCLHTWITEHLDTTTYLCVTADGPGCGKTRLLELSSLLCRNSKLIADTTGPTLFKIIDSFGAGKCALLFDEAEKYSSGAVSVVRSLMNAGYRSGQTVDRSTKEGYVSYPAYCAKAFSLMGDLNPALRSRSLVVRLKKAKPGRAFHWNEARTEAATLVVMAQKATWKRPQSIEPAHLEDPRDVEIFSGLYATAHALDVGADVFAILDRVSSDVAQQKKHAARKYAVLQQTDDPLADKAMGYRALMDLASVTAEGEPFLWSSVAVERMKAIVVGPWRMFVDDEGLTQDRLARLLSPFNLKRGTATMLRGKGARQADKAKGFYAASVRDAAKVLIEMRDAGVL